MILLNGKEYELDTGTTIKSLLESLGISKDGTAVAVNASIIPRPEHQNQLLKDGDEVEVIRAIGGG